MSLRNRENAVPTLSRALGTQAQPGKLLGFTSGTVLPMRAGEMEQIFPSFSSARAEAHYKCLCSREGERDIVAVFKTK